MITVKRNESIFQHRNKAFACNLDGHLPKILVQLYPEAAKEYKRLCKSGDFTLGSLVAVKEEDHWIFFLGAYNPEINESAVSVTIYKLLHVLPLGHEVAIAKIEGASFDFVLAKINQFQHKAVGRNVCYLPHAWR